MTIEFKDVWKSFKNTYAIKGVTCTVQDKEIFGLLGPNGAGKTTLIMTMATVYRATKGEITRGRAQCERRTGQG